MRVRTRYGLGGRLDGLEYKPATEAWMRMDGVWVVVEGEDEVSAYEFMFEYKRLALRILEA